MNYPKTSCACSECPPNKKYQYEINKVIPCSLGVPDCKKSLELEYCTTNKVYKQDIQPQNKLYKYKYLNKLGLSLDEQKYVPVKCNLSKQCQYVYNGHNPLLTEAFRGQKLMLDRPNYTGEVPVGNVCHDEIYTPYFKNYGKNYTNYNDITGGQIQYYIDTSDAYFPPNFITPAIVDHTIQIDPMGVVRPEYNRLTLKQYDWDKCNKDECDSFTHDTLEFRQELMEKQMRKINEQKYELRWGNNEFKDKFILSKEFFNSKHNSKYNQNIIQNIK